MEQNLSTYRIFYEVAKSGNISKAAEQLYISQPAISKTIVRLEDSLEIKLFKRNSRGVSLTDEGKVLFQYIKDAFAHIQEAEETLQKMKDFHIGHLDIGASSTLCRFILLPYLKAFMKEYPNIRISLKNQDSGKTLHLLEDHQIDLALAALPKKLGINQEILMEREVEDILVAAPQYLHNLKKIRGEAFSLFQDANVMLLEEQNLSRHHIENYL
ncbi:LysR family transcriptional regulator, partial [Oribacterium sp.]